MRQPDGRPDGGDALELLCRVSPEGKSAVMRRLGREMVTEARMELEQAAQRGVLPPQWVQAIMSEAGWSQYRKLCQDEHDTGA